MYTVSAAARAWQVSVLGGLLVLALFFPYLWFGVTPFSSDYEVSPDELARLLEGKNLPDYYAVTLPQRTPEELAAQKEAFTWCRFCHTLEQGGHNRVGPNLHRIYGQPFAVVAEFPYSRPFLDAKEAGMVWTPELMRAFIQDPHGMIPGNRMRYPPLIGYDKSAERDAMILEYLLRETR